MSGKKLVLIVVDGMTPAAFERAVESGRAPALARLAEHGVYRHATSVFPSLTPVCLSSIATGVGPDVHHIPHLVWWHRGERRIVEYGSSFAALVAAGLAFVPVAGYLEALALPAFAARLRRRQPERYAGLRTLAK